MGAFDNLFPNEQDSLSYTPQGYFDDIVENGIIQQQLAQQAAQQQAQQSGGGSIIDGIANNVEYVKNGIANNVEYVQNGFDNAAKAAADQAETTLTNVGNTIKDWGNNVKNAWDNYNYQVGNAIVNASNENGGVVPMVVSDDPEATLTQYGGTDYTNARRDLYNEAIGKPAANLAITPFMPTPIRAVAGIAAAPMIAGDLAEIATQNAEAKANGEAPEGIMGNPVVATAKQFAIDPIIDPVTRAVSDPSGFIGNIVDNPTNLWSDVFLPVELTKGAVPKGVKEGVYNKVSDVIPERVGEIKEKISDTAENVRNKAAGAFDDIGRNEITNETPELAAAYEPQGMFEGIIPEEAVSDYVTPERPEGGYEETGNIQNDIYNRYRAAGFTDVEAAALTGNIGAESSFDTRVVSHDEYGSEGLIQFTDDRLQGLKDYAAERGLDPYDWKTQIDFSIHELTEGNERAALNTMREHPDATPEEMAVIVRREYERPNPNVARDEERQRIARETFDGNYGDYKSTPRNGVSENGESRRIQQAEKEIPHEIVESDKNNSQVNGDKENLNISAKNDLIESDLSRAKDDLNMNTSTDNTNGVRNENKAVFDDLAENNAKKEAISQNIDISPKELADKLKESEDFNSGLEKTSEQKILEYKNQSQSELIDTIKDNIHELRQGVLDPLGDTGKVDFGTNRKTIDGITKQFGLERQTDSISVKRAFATTLVKDTIKSPDIILRETLHDGTSFKRTYVKYWKDTNNVVRSVSVEMTNGEMGKVATNNVDSLARKVEKADAIEYARDKAVNANNTGHDNNTISEDVERLERPVTRREIINTVNELFNQRVKSGRLGKSKDVLGWYNRMTEVIRTRNFGDINTLMHELGHHVDHKNGFSIDPKFNTEFSKVVHERFGKVYDKLGDEGIRKEGYAEFFHDYVSDRNKAKADFPTFYDHFTERLAKDKELNGAINKLSKVTHEWFKQAPEERVKGSISFDDGKLSTRIKDISDNGGFKEKLSDLGHSLYTHTIDELHPFEQLMKEVNKQIGKEIPFENDVYKQAWLFRGATGKAQALVEFGDKAAGVKGLKAILEPIGIKERKNFSAYLVAKHDLDFHANGQKATFSKAEDVATLRKFEKNETFKKAADELQKYQQHLLQQLVKSGMLKPEIYAELVKKYPNYVPFFRDFKAESMDGFLASSKGFINVASPIKRFKGSTRDIIDPLQSILRNTYQFTNAIERNKVAQNFAKLADIHGMGRIVEQVKEGSARATDNTFTVWQRGKKVVYETTPELKAALEMSDRNASNLLVRIMQTPASWLRAGATSTTGFALANLVRDNVSAAIFSKHGYLPVFDTLKGVSQFIKKGELYQEYLRSGASGAAMVSLDRDYMGGQIREILRKEPTWQKVVKNPIEVMRAISEASEISTRLAEYDNARKGYTGLANRLFGSERKSLTPQQAAIEARDITIDFSRIGKNTKTANRVVAFFNAAVQGADKLRRVWKEDPVGASIRATLFVTIPTVALWQLNKDNPEYQELPQYVKDTYWILPSGDHLIKIPKPFELGVLYGTSVERMLQWMDDKEHGRKGIGFKGYGERVADVLTPSVMPTAFIPIAEWAANYSFWRQKSIVPQAQQDLPNALQYGQNTSAVAKGIGLLFNVSPYKVDNTIRGYGGNLATLGLTAIDAATGETANRPAKRWYEMPEINKFTATPYQGSNSVQRVYDDFDAQNKLFNEAKITKQKPEDFDVRQFVKLKEAREQLTKLSRASKAIMNNENISGEQKREQLDRFNVLKANIARRVYGYDRVK
nr:MAG TPA: Type I restriction enzyme Methylase [Caudoviricetes sp.]